jgi:hypothetical protein
VAIPRHQHDVVPTAASARSRITYLTGRSSHRSTDFAEIHPWLVVWHGNEIPVLQYLHDHNYVCYKEGHEHWCVGGQRAIAAGLTEFCGCQHIYAGCQAFPADPAATPPPTDED